MVQVDLGGVFWVLGAQRGTSFRYTLPVPADPSLVDVQLMAQNVSLDPCLPLARAELSGGLELTLGR